VDDSELHLEREDMFKDLFDHAQPKARLEDLVRRYGVREGIVSVPGTTTAQPSPSISASRRTAAASTSSPPPSPVSPQSQSATSRFFNLFSRPSEPKLGSTTPTPYNPPSPPRQVKIRPISFSRVTISLSPRTIGLNYGSGAHRRTLVQIERARRNQTLEMDAKALINELKEYLIAEA
jgi:hypothetical protein